MGWRGGGVATDSICEVLSGIQSIGRNLKKVESEERAIEND